MLENLPWLPLLFFSLAKAVCGDGFQDAMKKRHDVHLLVVDESHTIKIGAGER